MRVEMRDLSDVTNKTSAKRWQMCRINEKRQCQTPWIDSHRQETLCQIT